MDENESPERAGAPGRRLGRRRVLWSAAWSAPVVVVAARAPAVAASPGVLPARLSFDEFGVFRAADDPVSGKPTAVAPQLQVQNLNYAPFPQVSATLTSLTVVVRFPTQRVGAAPTPTRLTGTGWAYTGSTTSGTDTDFTFIWTGSLPPGGSTSRLRFQVALSDRNPGPFGVSASASGVNATTLTDEKTYTQP